MSLLKSTATVSGMTLVSRVLGLVRDMVFARFLGVDAGTDAFFVAFRIPNFLRRLFAEGAFSQAFVPVLSEYREKTTEEEVRRLTDYEGGLETFVRWPAWSPTGDRIVFERYESEADLWLIDLH